MSQKQTFRRSSIGVYCGLFLTLILTSLLMCAGSSSAQSAGFRRIPLPGLLGVTLGGRTPAVFENGTYSASDLTGYETTFTGQQPPSNDNFVNSVPITATIGSPGTAMGTNVGATIETGEPLDTSGSGGHTVWWSWTAAESGLVTIDTLGSSYDTTLGIYTGTAVNALTLVADNDDIDYPSIPQSRVMFNAIAGTQYQISVDGYSSLEGTITVNVTPLEAPAIMSFTPTSGPVGTVVTLTGHGFTDATAISFNGTEAETFFAASDTQATATVPQYATTGAITLTTSQGSATSSAPFTVTTADAPTITSFTPTSAYPQTTVTITGTNFFSPSAVMFSGTSTVFTVSADGTTVTATVPAGATTGPITVVCPGGTATSTTFTVLMPATNDDFVDRVTVVATMSAPGTAMGSNVGATIEPGEPLNTSGSGNHTVWWSWTADASGPVTIDTFGSSFDTTLGVYTGTAVNALTLVADNDDDGGGLQSQVKFNAVAGTQYQISVDGYSTSEGNITLHVTPTTLVLPTVTSFTPSSGPVGSTVVFTGSGFNTVSAVRFHDARATVFASNAAGTQLTVTVPEGAAKGTITITNFLGSATTTTPFRITYRPVITSFSPMSGPVGTVVTITGTYLNNITRVRFHLADATVYSSNADGTQLIVTVPPGTHTGTITLDNRDALASTSRGVFTVTP